MKYWRNFPLYVAVFVFLIISLVAACGPSKEEHDAQQASLAKIESDNGNSTATYYMVDSCEYFGRLNSSPNDFLVNNGNCSHCQQRQARIIDSLIKKNLKEFFAMEKR